MFDVFYSKGSDFLMYYFFLGVVSVVVYLIYRNRYLSNDVAKSQVDSFKEDPYFLSFLQGGEVVVMKLAIWSLSLKKAVKLQYSKSKTSARFTYDKSPNGLHSVENILLTHLEKIGDKSDFKECLLSETIRTDVKNHMLERYEFLERSSLYLSETKKKHLKDVRSGIFFVLIGIAAIKIIVALNTGHSNVFFLILMCIGFLIGISKIKKKKPLSEVESFINKLKRDHKKTTISILNSLDIDGLLLAVSINGINILAGTIHSDFYTMLKNQKSKSSSDKTIGCMTHCYIGCSCSFYSSSTGCSSCGSSCSSGGSSCSSCSSSCSGCGGCGGD